MIITILIQSLAKYIYSFSLRVKNIINNTNFSSNQWTIEIHPKNPQSLTLIKFMLNESFIKPKTLLDVWAVDYPKRYKEYRFQINYMFISYLYNTRIRQYLFTNYLQSVPSMTPLFPSANWLEREVWDLFGVWFSNHPDLRNILTDYGFEGNPMRKDFPLIGYNQVRYDDEQKRIIYEAVSLNQDYRTFTFFPKQKKILS